MVGPKPLLKISVYDMNMILPITEFIIDLSAHDKGVNLQILAEHYSRQESRPLQWVTAEHTAGSPSKWCVSVFQPLQVPPVLPPEQQLRQKKRFNDHITI